MLYSLSIPKGTIVMAESGGTVTLKGDVYVDGAERQEDGAFIYTIGDESRYCVSAGCCYAVAESGAMRHKDGLVWIG